MEIPNFDDAELNCIAKFLKFASTNPHRICEFDNDEIQKVFRHFKLMPSPILRMVENDDDFNSVDFDKLSQKIWYYAEHDMLYEIYEGEEYDVIDAIIEKSPEDAIKFINEWCTDEEFCPNSFDHLAEKHSWIFDMLLNTEHFQLHREIVCMLIKRFSAKMTPEIVQLINKFISAIS